VAVVTCSPPSSDRDLIFSDDGPPIAIEAYARVAFKLQIAGADVWLPWISVTVSPFVLPVPVAFDKIATVVLEMLPGQTGEVEVLSVDDFEELPKEKKPKKQKADK